MFKTAFEPETNGFAFANSWGFNEADRQVLRDGEPWLSGLVSTDYTTYRDVLLAFEERDGGIDALVDDAGAALEDGLCLLYELEGACEVAVCGEEIHTIDTDEHPCGILGLFPYGTHEQGDADSLVLYDHAADAFVEFGQRHDMLWGWQTMGCACAVTEGPAQSRWYAMLAAVLGLTALIRRRER